MTVVDGKVDGKGKCRTVYGVYTAREKCRKTCRQGDLPRLSAKKPSAGIHQKGKLGGTKTAPGISIICFVNFGTMLAPFGHHFGIILAPCGFLVDLK